MFICYDLLLLFVFLRRPIIVVRLYELIRVFYAFFIIYVIVRPLSTVGYTIVVASVIHSRQWSN